jgi:hypothetical protein
MMRYEIIAHANRTPYELYMYIVFLLSEMLHKKLLIIFFKFSYSLFLQIILIIVFANTC